MDRSYFIIIYTNVSTLPIDRNLYNKTILDFNHNDHGLPSWCNLDLFIMDIHQMHE